MKVADGMKVTLFASEQDFPELAKPVQMQFDSKGRLWVAVWPSYPHWKPTEEMNDKILIFEDTKGTGNMLYLPIDKLIANGSQALAGPADGTVPTTRLPEVQVTTPDDSGRARIR